MTNSSPAWKYVGLAIALIAGPALLGLQTELFGPVNNNVPQTLTRELMLFGLAAALVLIILRGERSPLASLGWRPDTKAHISSGSGNLRFSWRCECCGPRLSLPRRPVPKFHGFMPPPLVMTLVVLRAAIVEEFFYRAMQWNDWRS